MADDIVCSSIEIANRLEKIRFDCPDVRLKETSAAKSIVVFMDHELSCRSFPLFW